MNVGVQDAARVQRRIRGGDGRAYVDQRDAVVPPLRRRDAGLDAGNPVDDQIRAILVAAGIDEPRGNAAVEMPKNGRFVAKDRGLERDGHPRDFQRGGVAAAFHVVDLAVFDEADAADDLPTRYLRAAFEIRTDLLFIVGADGNEDAVLQKHTEVRQHLVQSGLGAAAQAAAVLDDGGHDRARLAKKRQQRGGLAVDDLGRRAAMPAREREIALIE